MNIYEALKAQSGMRLSLGGRWLVWSDTTSQWEVWQHIYGARKSNLIASGDSCDELLKYLVREEK